MTDKKKDPETQPKETPETDSRARVRFDERGSEDANTEQLSADYGDMREGARAIQEDRIRDGRSSTSDKRVEKDRVTRTAAVGGAAAAVEREGSGAVDEEKVPAENA